MPQGKPDSRAAGPITETPLPPIDFARYPLDRGDSPALETLVADCRAQLDRRQYCSLPGFVDAHAIDEIVADTLPLLEHANRADSWRNCYLQRQRNDAFSTDHPRNIFNHASYRMLAADLFPSESPLQRLYYWPAFQRLVAAIVGVPRLYPSEDPLQPVNVICYGDGDESAWHYDSNNAFTMTLMLQAARQGGRFEIAPNTRNGEDDEDIAYMQAVLGGDRKRVENVSREPGELTIFRGCNSLHRVSPVAGERLRLMAVFVYEEQPGVAGDPEVNLTVYGRTGR